MKKFLLFAFAFIGLSSLVKAQIEKGTVLLGGNLYFSSNKSESTTPPNNRDKSTNFGIHPAVGVAIKPNTILGLQLGYSQGESSIEPSSGSQEYTSYRTEFFLRRYLTLGKGFHLFGQPGVYFNRSINKYNNFSGSGYKNKGWDAGISLYPGISYAVTKRFHLEAGLGNMANLSYGKNKHESKSSTNGQISKSEGSNFTFSSSLSNGTPITIGFRFFLPNKTKS